MASFKVNRKLGDNEQLDSSRPMIKRWRKRSEDLCAAFDETIASSKIEVGRCYNTDNQISCLRLWKHTQAL